MITRSIAILAIVLSSFLSSATAAAPIPHQPQLQNIYIEFLLQGQPQSGCSSARAGNYVELWFLWNGNQYFTYGTTTSCGQFNLAGMENGVFSITYYAKVQRHLAVGQVTSSLCGNNCNSYITEDVVRKAGDSAGSNGCGSGNGNNQVDAFDFNSMKNAFGTACGYPAYNERDDFTNNCVIDVGDSVYIQTNYGQAGSTCSWCVCPLNRNELKPATIYRMN